VLACGDGAALSHRSAGHALGIIPARPRLPEVTKPTTSGYERDGIVVHRVSAIDPADRTVVHDIPMMTAPRVLLDLAPSLTEAELTRACHEAWIRHHMAPGPVDACIGRNPTKKGAAKLRRALVADATLSKLEDGFLTLLDRHDLPRPRTNIDRAGDKVDCYWPRHALTVELLSYRFHASRQAFESDVARRRRSNHIAYTWGDVFERAAQTAAELARLLS
jgi:hypothetical protein